MAPIYDSGSSLARELKEEKIKKMLEDETELSKYIEGGKAEVHWMGKKLNHFSLINHLLNSSYLEEVISAASFLKSWDEQKANEIVNKVDIDVPAAWHSYCIPNFRKELMVKLLILRSQKLIGLINDRV